MSAPELLARVWAPGTDFPEPIEGNWLYHLGLSVICILWVLSLIIISLRIWARWTSKQIGVGTSSELCSQQIFKSNGLTMISYR